MTTPADNLSVEQNILRCAKQEFLAKGYQKANMSAIAERAGINRTTLHYYFRTKDIMFQAVFSGIISSFVPEIHRIILENKPFSDRISEVVDVYYGILKENPSLPLFVFGEIQRDPKHLYNTIRTLEFGQYAARIRDSILAEMDAGKLRKMPIEFVVYTFYGLVILPFVTRPLAEIIFDWTDNNYEEKMTLWKQHVIRQMDNALTPDTIRFPKRNRTVTD